MKRNKKYIAENKQEQEDFELYTLYDTILFGEQKKSDKKNNTGSKIAKAKIKKSLTFIKGTLH